MLATSVALGWCYGAASALVLRLRRGNIGPRPLECVLAAVDDLTRPDEDPRSGPRPAELVGVKVGDGAPTLHGLGQPAQKDAVAPGCRNAPGAIKRKGKRGDVDPSADASKLSPLSLTPGFSPVDGWF